MPDALAVVARFSTDRGPAVVRGVYGTEDLGRALTDLARHLEAQGVFPVKLLRVYRQHTSAVNFGTEEAPDWREMDGTQGPMERVPEGMFHVTQESL